MKYKAVFQLEYSLFLIVNQMDSILTLGDIKVELNIVIANLFCATVGYLAKVALEKNRKRRKITILTFILEYFISLAAALLAFLLTYKWESGLHLTTVTVASLAGMYVIEELMNNGQHFIKRIFSNKLPGPLRGQEKKYNYDEEFEDDNYKIT